MQGFLLGASEDGTSVYLVAQGVLAGNENGNGETAEAGQGQPLRAALRAARNGRRTFIADAVKRRQPEWEGNEIADTAFLTARVSPNGRYLAFMSAASPTGYDNVDQNRSGKGTRRGGLPL